MPNNRVVPFYACMHGTPGGCQFCNATTMEQKPNRSPAAQALIDQALAIQAERDRLRERCRKLEEALRDAQGVMQRIAARIHTFEPRDLEVTVQCWLERTDAVRALLNEKE